VGLTIAAGFTTALALCGLALLLARAEDRRSLTLAFILALPLQPLAFYAVRAPLDDMLKATFGFPSWVAVASLLYAPLTEEPAKWLAAALPMVRRAIALHPVAVALAVGIGFGIGEIWFLVHAIVNGPNYPDLPFWMFGGFVVERLEVCFLHGAFVALPFVALARGGSFWLGGLAGMALHFLLNFPVFLARMDMFGLGAAWLSVLQLWVLASVVACAFMVWRLARHPYAARPG
jgi:hypothetical protein